MVSRYNRDMTFRSAVLGFAFGAMLLAADANVEKARKMMGEKKFEEAVTLLEPAQKAQPKSAELQKALSEAYLGKADSFMYNEALPPMRKYPAALRAYRQALTMDKSSKKAKENIATIEGIYTQMGRPIPQ